MAFRSVGNVLRSPRKTQVQDASARQGRRRAVHPPLARLGAAAGLVGAPVRSAVLAARAPRRGDHAAAHRARPPWRRNLLLRQRLRDQPRRDGRDPPRVHHQAGVPDLADSRLGDRPDLGRQDRGSLIRRHPVRELLDRLDGMALRREPVLPRLDERGRRAEQGAPARPRHRLDTLHRGHVLRPRRGPHSGHYVWRRPWPRSR
jgi:hypothetical protein